MITILFFLVSWQTVCFTNVSILSPENLVYSNITVS